MNGRIFKLLLIIAVSFLCLAGYAEENDKTLQLSKGEKLQFTIAGTHERLWAIVSLQSRTDDSVALRFKVVTDAISDQDYADLYWRHGHPQSIYFGDLSIISDEQQVDIFRGPRGRGSVHYTIKGAAKSLVLKTHFHEKNIYKLITKSVTVESPATPEPKSTPKNQNRQAGVYLSSMFTGTGDDGFVDMACQGGDSGKKYSKLNLFYKAKGLKPELVVAIHLKYPDKSIRAKHFIHSMKGYEEKTAQNRTLQLVCVSTEGRSTSKSLKF